jgi:hypothetical protein
MSTVGLRAFDTAIRRKPRYGTCAALGLHTAGFRFGTWLLKSLGLRSRRCYEIMWTVRSGIIVRRPSGALVFLQNGFTIRTAQSRVAKLGNPLSCD